MDRGVSRGQRGGSLTVVNLSFLDPNTHITQNNTTKKTTKTKKKNKSAHEATQAVKDILQPLNTT
jgi:hypothetical protein